MDPWYRVLFDDWIRKTLPVGQLLPPLLPRSHLWVATNLPEMGWGAETPSPALPLSAGLFTPSLS